MLEFKTKTGNTYAWDDELGLFIPFPPIMRAVAKEMLSSTVPTKAEVIERLIKNFGEDDVSFYYDWLKKWKKIQPHNHDLNNYHKVSPSEAKFFLLRHGIQQLILNVTEDCNFRCKYCAFSDYYEYRRSYSKKYMSFSTAKTAIDMYFSLLEESRRYNPLRKEPAVGFYGGEPLLNFDLIKKCVDYIEREYHRFKVRYNVTTNGSLLDKDKAGWLMQHNFSIGVSIDGPEEVHDRNRIYANGNGTFKDVIKNIRPIIDVGYKNIKSLAVYDWKSDIFKIDEFFKRNDIPAIGIAAAVSSSGGGKYYSQFSEKDKEDFLRRIDAARDYYYRSIKNQGKRERSFFELLFGLGIQVTLFGPVAVSPYPLIAPCTSTCIPGRKLFVDVDGNFHACEKIPETMPFGNLTEGFNYERISNMLNDYFGYMDRCHCCGVKRACNSCFATFAEDKGFVASSEICKEIEAMKAEQFAEAFEFAEMNPEFVEFKNDLIR